MQLLILCASLLSTPTTTLSSHITHAHSQHHNHSLHKFTLVAFEHTESRQLYTRTYLMCFYTVSFLCVSLPQYFSINVFFCVESVSVVQHVGHTVLGVRDRITCVYYQPTYQPHTKTQSRHESCAAALANAIPCLDGHADTLWICACSGKERFDSCRRPQALSNL
jgi:hypothetical protein